MGDPEKPNAEIERGVAVHLGRQAILTRKLPSAPRLEVVLHEGTLRRRFADKLAMIEQLHKINDVSSLTNVSIQVLPMDAGIHRAALTGGSFAILEFSPNGRETEPPVVYSDGLTGALYLDKSQEVAAYEDVWTSIQAISLTVTQSRRLITELAKEYGE